MSNEEYVKYQETFIRQLIDYGNSKDPEQEIEELIKSLSIVTNTFGFNPKEIMQMAKKDINAEANLIQLSYEWVDFWNRAPEYRTDGRNEISTTLCKKISKALIEEYGCIVERTKFKGLDEEVCKMHRTLVQTATNLFSKVLAENDKVVRALFEREYGEKDLRLPLI